MSVNQVEDNEKAEPKPNAMHIEEAGAAEADTTKVDAVTSDEKPEVDASLKKRLQILNVLAWIICMVLNSTSQKIMPVSLRDITDLYQTTIAPANYAFAIWGVIYLLISIFAVYQALPDSCVPSRNNDLIFNQIKYVFAINMIGNSLWLVLFMTNGSVGFALSLIDIILMLGTQVFIMQKSVRSKVNVMEFIGLRMGFSIYTGWVTAATILNVSFLLKSLGLKGANAGLSESTWTCVILYVALIVYVLASFMERNPLYGAIYIWVVAAIRNRQTAYANIQSNSMIVLILIIVHVTLLTTLCTYEKMKGKATKGFLF